MCSGSHSPLPWSTSAIPTASDGSVKAAEEPPPVKLARTKSFIGRTTRIAGQSSGATERSQTSWGNVHVAVSSAYVRSKNTSPNRRLSSDAVASVRASWSRITRAKGSSSPPTSTALWATPWSSRSQGSGPLSRPLRGRQPPDRPGRRPITRVTRVLGDRAGRRSYSRVRGSGRRNHPARGADRDNLAALLVPTSMPSVRLGRSGRRGLINSMRPAGLESVDEVDHHPVQGGLPASVLRGRHDGAVDLVDLGRAPGR